jgi:GntR family phosphonate transport system transcriptional regulator
MDELVMTAPKTAPPLLRQEGVTVWRQIAEKLRAEIEAGDPSPGGRLPTEADLAQRFGVNRHTVRRALEELSRAGLLRIEQGRGSFVAEDVLEYVIGPRTRFSEWIRRYNKEPSGRVLQLTTIAADLTVAAALGIAADDKVFLLERLGQADGMPVSLALHYFPADRLPGLLDALHEAGSITEALKQVGVDDYLRQVTRVSARLPAGREAELLRMPRNRPLLLTEAINVDRDGAIIEYGTTCYPTPRVQIVFESNT